MTLAEITKAVTGLISGDKAVTITAAGATQKIQTAVGEKLQNVGQSLSKVISPAVFNALQDGSKKTESSDLNKATNQVIGAMPTSYKIGAVLVVITLGWLIFRKA